MSTPITDEQRKLRESCYLCGKGLVDGKPQCSHPEVSTKAAQILMSIEFCDHYCCGMTETLCKATHLTKELADHDAAVRRETLEEAAQHWPIGELGTLDDFRCSCGAVLICSPTQEKRIAAWKYHIRTLAKRGAK